MKYKISPSIDKAIIKWVKNNCTDDPSVLPEVGWSHNDGFGGPNTKMRDPFVILNIMDMEMVGRGGEPSWNETKGVWEIQPQWNFALSVAHYDNREDHSVMKAVQNLISSLYLSETQKEMRSAGLSFMRPLTQILDLSFLQSTATKFRSQVDLSFTYIDVVEDTNAGLIDTVVIEESMTADNGEIIEVRNVLDIS